MSAWWVGNGRKACTWDFSTKDSASKLFFASSKNAVGNVVGSIEIIEE